MPNAWPVAWPLQTQPQLHGILFPYDFSSPRICPEIQASAPACCMAASSHAPARRLRSSSSMASLLRLSPTHIMQLLQSTSATAIASSRTCSSPTCSTKSRHYRLLSVSFHALPGCVQPHASCSLTVSSTPISCQKSSMQTARQQLAPHLPWLSSNLLLPITPTVFVVPLLPRHPVIVST